MMFTFLIACPSIGNIKSRERFVAFAIVAACPFIAIRLLYSILAVFVHNHWFSTLNGSVGVRVGMATVEEYIVVIIYISIGFVLQKLTEEQRGPIESRPWKERKARRSSPNRSHRNSSRSRDGRTAPSSASAYQPQPLQYPYEHGPVLPHPPQQSSQNHYGSQV